MDTRRETMRSMRLDDNMTLREIGEVFGISRERVRQIVGNIAEHLGFTLMDIVREEDGC